MVLSFTGSKILVGYMYWNDRSIYYRRLAGDANSPCLVFLHEGLGCVAGWKGFPERLCRRTGCSGLLFDRLGYGRSDPSPEPWDIDFMHRNAREELPAVLNELIPDQAHICVGHSDGGSIALIYAALQPDHLLGSITEAAHVFVEPETLKGIEATRAAYRSGELAGLTKYHGKQTDALMRAWSEIWLSPSFRSWNITGLLGAISSPLLAVQGRQDSYGTEAQVDAIVSGLCGPATPLLLDDCGHAPHRNRPEATLKEMAAFIERLV
jgi:pimeloyl-ACP methyl ester carboxylesterase